MFADRLRAIGISVVIAGCDLFFCGYVLEKIK